MSRGHRVSFRSAFKIPFEINLDLFLLLQVLQNFWLFCNQRVPDVERLIAAVENQVEDRNRLEARIEEFKARINQRRSKAVEDRATEEALVEDIEQLKKTLEELTGKREVLDGEKLQVELKLASLAATWEDMEAKKATLSKEIATLQGVFEGAAVMERLDLEIAQLNEDLEGKERRKVEFRNNLEMLERSKEEYGAALELIKAISREGERMREIVGRLREQAGKMEGVKMDMDELESELRDAQQQVSWDYYCKLSFLNLYIFLLCCFLRLTICFFFRLWSERQNWVRCGFKQIVGRGARRRR